MLVAKRDLCDSSQLSWPMQDVVKPDTEVNVGAEICTFQCDSEIYLKNPILEL